jgi:hypothetical protein
VRVLDRPVWLHGLPEALRVDNGPELISTTRDAWASRHGVKPAVGSTCTYSERAQYELQPGMPVTGPR